MTLNALNNPNDSASIFESLNPARAAEKGKAGSAEEMGSEEFLQLMIAQLENQDPTKPMDQMAFMSQLAQFTQVSGIQELNASFFRTHGNPHRATGIASLTNGRSQCFHQQ